MLLLWSCPQRGPVRLVGWVCAQWMKQGTYEYSSSLTHTLPPTTSGAHLQDQERSKGQGEKMRGWVPWSHRKAEGCCTCTWTEPRQEWGKPHCLVTESHGDTSRQAVPFVLQFPLRCQLQGSHWHPTMARTMSCGMFPWQCPWLGPVLGLYTGTK